MSQSHATTLLAAGVLCLMTGCATTKTTTATGTPDPWEGWNRGVQSFNDEVDHHLMKPIAKGYRWITPAFIDTGITNFFNNIGDIRVTMNDALQGKLAQSGRDGARFIVNTTAGVGGFLDVASRIDLPRHDEDFDQTLAVWGIPSGPYVVLPFLGPSSSRGIFGLVGDAAMNPLSYTGAYFASGAVSTAVSGGLGAVNVTDLRADNLATEKIASEAALDRYEFFRDSYLSQRNYLIKDGNVPEEDVLKFQETEDKGLAPINPY